MCPGSRCTGSWVLRYRVEVKRSAQRELGALPRRIQAQLGTVLDALAENPRPAGAAVLKGYPGLYRLRVAGSYRRATGSPANPPWRRSRR